jgi:hypothetical protein
MRFNKFTHLSLLVVFAIIFIVIYLYYTILDVKKIHQEVSKLSRDMEFLNGSLQQMTTALLTNTIPMSTPGSVPDVRLNAQPETENDTKPDTTTLGHTQVQAQEVESDCDEVASQELQQIMESIENEEEEVEQNSVSPNAPNAPNASNVDINTIETIEPIEPIETITNRQSKEPSVTIQNLTMEELKKVPYDDIKKYCKEHSINTKGTKDVLIYRIAQSKA